MGYANSIIGGAAALIRAAIKSPNFVSGLVGWSINKDGTAEFNNVTVRGEIDGTNYIINSTGVFFYAGPPALGNLVASDAVSAGTDQFGNAFLAGGTTYDLAGDYSQLAAGAVNIANSLDVFTIAANQSSDELDITSANGALGVALTPSTLTVDGGPLVVDEALSYGGTSGVVVKTFNSSGTLLVPAGVTQVRIQAWGGGGGGGSGGGAGGGGGEYAEEPASPVTAGGTITVTVGAAGSGGAAGAFNNGTAGGSTTVSGAGVTSTTAHGGGAGQTSGSQANGGTGSANSIHRNGGKSGTSTSSRGGAGGGGGAGTSAAGGNGTNSSGDRVPGVGGSGGSTGGGNGSGGGWGTTTSGGSTGGSAGGTGVQPGGAGGGGGYNGSSAASSKAGGPGGKGKVILTYTVPTTTLAAAVAGTAGTDAGGNAWAAGYTGPVTAFKPATSPTVAETWHDMRPLSNSFVGTVTGEYPPQYRLAADGEVELFGTIQLPGAGSYNGITFFTLPSGYRPLSHPVSWPASQLGGNMSTDTTAGIPRVFVDTTGACQVSGISPSINATNIRIDGRFPLDNTGLITS